MDRPSVPVSDEDLQEAWRRLRHRSWPATLNETLQDRKRESLLRSMARYIAGKRARGDRATERAPARCAPPAPPPRIQPPGWVDYKRAAAGDRDD